MYFPNQNTFCLQYFTFKLKGKEGANSIVLYKKYSYI